MMVGWWLWWVILSFNILFYEYTYIYILKIMGIIISLELGIPFLLTGVLMLSKTLGIMNCTAIIHYRNSQIIEYTGAIVCSIPNPVISSSLLVAFSSSVKTYHASSSLYICWFLFSAAYQVKWWWSLRLLMKFNLKSSTITPWNYSNDIKREHDNDIL